MSWSVARKALIDSPSVGQRNSSPESTSSSLEGADPELCISLMERGLNFTGLKHRILSADQQWIEQFLAIGGITAIFNALDALGQRGFTSIADALRQLECVACVKAIMNNRFGLEFIIASPGEGFVKKLAQVLDTNNGLVKTQILELLSVLCVYSTDGYKLALEALHDYKVTKGLRYSFSLLINELKASETEEYTCCVLTFINCILSGTMDISGRLKLRNELIALELLEVLSRYRHTEDDNLATQMEVFHESHSHDNEQISMPGGVDINSHEDLFNALQAKVFNTPNSLPLLHILQNLLLLDRDTEISSAAWDGVEQFVQRAVLMESPETCLEKFQEKSLNKLRTKLQEEVNRKKKESSSSKTTEPQMNIPIPPPLPSLPDRDEAGIPVAPPLPTVPGVPVAPPLPAVPGVPVAPPLPPVPGVPVAPPLPAVPGVPVAPPLPAVPGVPVAPPLPAVPGVPIAPPLPSVPGVPVAPPLPTVPGVPVAPPLPSAPGVHVTPNIPPPPALPGMARPPAPPFPGVGGIPIPPAFPGAMPFHPGVDPVGIAPLTPFERARKHKPVSKMRKLNWVKVSKNTAASPSTLWHQTVSGAKSLKVEVDSGGVENLFAQAVIKKKDKESTSQEEKEPKKSKVVSLLDQKASLNVNIFLKQFKSRDNQSIVDMIVQGDVSRISLDQLRALDKLLPDSGQAEAIKSFSGDVKMLGTAEDFFRRLLQVKQYPLRIEAMQLRLEFQEKIEDLKPSISTLDQAITELLECSALSELFHVVLVTGNIINGGGRAGDAYGFTVSSLRRLKDTKSNIPRLSLIHYIAQLCEEQAPDILKIQQQLPSIEKASKFSHEYLESQVNELKTKVKRIKDKSKKAPDELKAQLKSFLNESECRLSELKESLNKVSQQIKCTAEYFCVDGSKFKVEELLSELLNFIREVENAVKENHQRVVLEEKRKKREEQKRAAEEARRKKLEAGGKVSAAPPPPDDDGCIIDNLLKEIRTGTTLRPTHRESIKQRRKSQLNADELAKLSVIVGKATARSSTSDPPIIEIPEDVSNGEVFSEAPSAVLTNTDSNMQHNAQNSCNSDSTPKTIISDISGIGPSITVTPSGIPSHETCCDSVVTEENVCNGEEVTPCIDIKNVDEEITSEPSKHADQSGRDLNQGNTSQPLTCSDTLETADNCVCMDPSSPQLLPDEELSNSNKPDAKYPEELKELVDDNLQEVGNERSQGVTEPSQRPINGNQVANDGNSIVNDDNKAVNEGGQVLNEGGQVVNEGGQVLNEGDHELNELTSNGHHSQDAAKPLVDQSDSHEEAQTKNRDAVMGVVDKLHKGSRMTTGLAVLSSVALSLVPEGSRLLHEKFN